MWYCELDPYAKSPQKTSVIQCVNLPWRWIKEARTPIKS